MDTEIDPRQNFEKFGRAYVIELSKVIWFVALSFVVVLGINTYDPTKNINLLRDFTTYPVLVYFLGAVVVALPLKVAYQGKSVILSKKEVWTVITTTLLFSLILVFFIYASPLTSNPAEGGGIFYELLTGFLKYLVEDGGLITIVGTIGILALFFFEFGLFMGVGIGAIIGAVWSLGTGGSFPGGLVAGASLGAIVAPPFILFDEEVVDRGGIAGGALAGAIVLAFISPGQPTIIIASTVIGACVGSGFYKRKSPSEA